ncbi:hypothetical protein XELAEV_18003277mg [Xenopus laevis]|nr:hypothetical protein XELAEV_18003277mg [Xenopus laevis]
MFVPVLPFLKILVSSPLTFTTEHCLQVWLREETAHELLEGTELALYTGPCKTTLKIRLDGLSKEAHNMRRSMVLYDFGNTSFPGIILWCTYTSLLILTLQCCNVHKQASYNAGVNPCNL